MQALPLLCLLATAVAAGCGESTDPAAGAGKATYHERIVARLDVKDAPGPLADGMWAVRLWLSIRGRRETTWCCWNRPLPAPKTL